MKAVLFHQHGGLDVLEYTDFPTPPPKAGEALIRLRAAALNRMDVMLRNGWHGLKLELPHTNASLGCGHCEFCRNRQDNICRNRHLLRETICGAYIG